MKTIKIMTKLSKETAIEMYNSGIESVKKFALENFRDLIEQVKPLMQ